MRALPLILIALAACNGEPDDTGVIGPDPYDVTVGPYDATVRWTEYGIPHIQADDYGSLGFGLGNAFARDHVCTLADLIVKVRSERAAYFGPGPQDAHLDSDFAWLHLGVRASAEDLWFDVSPDVQDMLVGYAAGYNRFLADTPSAELPEECRNADWVQPISHIDLMSYHLHLGLLGSGYALTDMIATAQPPVTPQRRRNAPELETLDRFHNLELGSNGWAIGSTRSSTGKGMVLSNTHFPSQGERQWHEFHLQGPDGLDVYGASLMGVPVVNVGFNRHVSWTHTVSNNPRFTFYALDLDPADPTRYDSNGSFVAMSQSDYTIDVLQTDGSTDSVTRTMYRSEYGPMLNAPILGWNSLLAVTYRDANEGNIELYETWLGMNRADSLDAFKAAHRDHLGIPWVHTLAADAEGNAFYTDSANTPNLAPGVQAAWEDFRVEQPLAQLFWEQAGLYVFKGGDPTFDWMDDPDSPRPGVVPFDEAPQLERDDFLVNANENHWLTNPLAPLTGYSFVYDPEGTPRTPRTKMNNRFFLETGDDSASGADGLFTLDELQEAALSGRSSIAEDLRDQLVARCDGISDVTVSIDDAERTVDVSDACTALAAWDGQHRVDSQGAHVMREWLSSDIYTWDDIRDAGTLFEDGFDAGNPMYSPTTLATAPSEGEDPALQALGLAVARLTDAGIAMDARLGDIQFRRLGTHDIPTQGGHYQDGVISIADFSLGGDTTLLPDKQRAPVIHGTTDLTEEGYVVNSGNSWIMAMQFTEDGPEGRAVMVYSQSEDARSPHFVDQSNLYADETLRPILFDEADIAASPALVTEQLTHPGE